MGKQELGLVSDPTTKGHEIPLSPPYIQPLGHRLDFGVSPTFNIADLKPYLGEEDELPSRTTSFQEGTMMRTSIPLLRPQPLLLYILNQLLELAHAN